MRVSRDSHGQSQFYREARSLDSFNDLLIYGTSGSDLASSAFA